MATLTYTVTYEDGRSQKVKVKPRHLITLEDATEGNVLDEANATSRNAFKLPFIAATDPETFDEVAYKSWLKTVDEIDSDGDEKAATDGAPPVDGEVAEPVPTE
jgi:hypothetical protein